MVSVASSGPRHLPPEVLQAYAAGELDPARRGACEAHLKGCGRCRERLAQVRGLHQLLQAAQPRGPDDLAWRRIRDRVRSQLEEDAHQGVSTLDLVMGRRWVTAGLAAAAAVALMVWFGRKPEPKPAPKAVVARAAPVQALSTGAAPASVELGAGLEVELGARGGLEIGASARDAIELDLKTGRLVVSDFRAEDRTTSVEVRATPFRLRSRQASYELTRMSSGIEVDVATGQVTVTGPGLDFPEQIGPGAPKRLADPSAPSKVVAKVEPREKPSIEVDVPQVAPPGSRPREGAMVDETPVIEEATTRVEVEAPDDPVAKAWVEARAAYYRRRDLDETVRWAQEVRRIAGRRPEAKWATNLLCEAHTAAERAAEAVVACGELLERVSGEEARQVHKRLAELHRTKLKDCASAIEHYNKALVFGQTTPLDEDARLGRAECALQVGDKDLAKRDLAHLEASRTFRRPELIRRLRKRLSEGGGTQE